MHCKKIRKEERESFEEKHDVSVHYKVKYEMAELQDQS